MGLRGPVSEVDEERGGLVFAEVRSSEVGTNKTANARFLPWLSGFFFVKPY